MEFIVASRVGLFTITELAERFGISRKTANKWIERVREEGPQGLADRSKRPRHSPWATSTEIIKKIVECRRKHPSWGPKKLRRILSKRQPKEDWPATSTFALILKREGLACGRRRRPVASTASPRTAYVQATAPNLVWTADFKGQFRTGNGRLCYPLTVMDRYSRYLLACQWLARPTFAATQAAFERVFREFGLPSLIHSDNGTPFGSVALARLSRLQVWWLHLDILPEPIRPAHPDENAEHERMHRTLKAETARPPAPTGPAQQYRFDAFRNQYNFERPHEALNLDTPAEHYTPSPRRYPERLPQFEYPAHFERRLVSSSGHFSWSGRMPFLSEVLRHEYVGLEEVDDDVWDIHVGPVILGRFDGTTRTVADTRRLRLAPKAP